MSRYLDSSALLKLLIRERGTDAMNALWSRRDDSYASLLGYAELRSAVAAAIRSRRIHALDGADARTEVEVVWRSLFAIDIDADLVHTAGDLADRHRLRAADAIHLASAIRIREPDTAFVAFDARLREAAAAEGFLVLPEQVQIPDAESGVLAPGMPAPPEELAVTDLIDVSCAPDPGGTGWSCRVTLGGAGVPTAHEVTVGVADLVRLAPGADTPEALVRRSFVFLLAREPRESILRRFDLPLIGRYFPEYEREIRQDGGQPAR